MSGDKTGYAQGLKAALAAYNEVWNNWQELDASNIEECREEAMRAAIAALPAPAGVEVTVDELAELLPWSSTPLAEALLSRFTILAKPPQEGQGVMSDKLKPCPFCGSDFLMGQEPHDNHPVEGKFYIFHDYGPLDSPARKCRLVVQGHFDTKEEALAFWNTRVDLAKADPRS